jgi:serine transporter
MKNVGKPQLSGWNRFDSQWVLGLFGTAVGAGILFLPIRAGGGGFFPIIIMALLIFPMTYLSHLFLSRFVMSSEKNSDITEVVENGFGHFSGQIITVLYFFAIYPICLAYGVGITNTVNSFLINQLHLPELPRWLLAFVLISLMMIVMIIGKRFMLKVTTWLVYPLVASLFFFSLYLIPQWKLSALSLTEMPSLSAFLYIIWATIPVLVFAFNHSPAISSFSVDLKERYNEEAEEKAKKILLRTSMMLTGFIMFFVASVVLTLNPEQLAQAKAQNIPILSYFANISSSNYFLLFVGPLIAFTAITSSFFGHYLGAIEGLNGIVCKQVKNCKKTPNMKIIKYINTAFIYFSMIIVAIINPSILGFIEDLGGPIIAAILFLMPMYAILKLPAMRKYANVWTNGFITITGLIAISGIVYKLIASIIG